ncbi:MAG TPA: serine protease [Abditibacteriaceae bacterium]|nr:serine protease [Abditibacteriaceae bacterium]
MTTRHSLPHRVLELLFTSVLCASLAIVPAHADAQSTIAQRLVKSHGASAVTLQIVVKLSAGDMGEDQAEREIDGVVLDASGLVVTTNSSIDPTTSLATMGVDASSYSSKVVGVKILTANGTEVPAKVVLRDRDRNLAFLRPLQKPKTPFVAVGFARGGMARIGDSVYILGRLGKNGSRQNSITSERLVSVITRPRLMYVVLPNMYTALGNVVFNESGQPLGLLTMRTVLKSGDTPLPIVIPAADIMEIARQAPQAGQVRERVAPIVAIPKKK